MDNFLYEDVTYEIIGCAYDTFKSVGVGFNENMYHKVFHKNLIQKGLDADYKRKIGLDYSGERIANFEIDEVVENKIIVELKCIQSDFLPENYAQIITYLKITGLRLGLLINFGLTKAQPKRIIFDEKIEPDSEYWDNKFFADVAGKEVTDTIIFLLRKIHATLGASLHSKIYQSALRIELRKNGLDFLDSVAINLNIENIWLGSFEIDYWLIEKFLLIGILAGKNGPRGYDILRMRSYLKRLNLHHGLIAFWSTTNLQLIGIYEP